MEGELQEAKAKETQGLRQFQTNQVRDCPKEQKKTEESERKEPKKHTHTKGRAYQMLSERGRERECESGRARVLSNQAGSMFRTHCDDCAAAQGLHCCLKDKPSLREGWAEGGQAGSQ